MNLLEKRANDSRLIAEGRFIRHVLNQEGQSILNKQKEVMASKKFRTNELYSKRSMEVSDGKLTLDFLTVHRFIDLKTRRTKHGVKRKKHHSIYNRIIFGHIPNIVRELSFGFTEEVIEKFKSLENPS